MQLLSKGSSVGEAWPLEAHWAFFSWAAWADLNLLVLCWFILALGATPSYSKGEGGRFL